jgi:DEAD/DEAH box helicase domain-containing protein
VVVLDELHTYRGVFGAHVALVLRRLRRLGARCGARPSFVAASATISNPVELAEQVVGEPFVEVQGDAAGAGPRRFLFWRPPLRGEPEANEHESILGEAAMIFAEALNAGYSGILFGRARVSVERMLLDVRRLVEPSLAERVSAYKSGYRADERARIEAGLRSGHLRGVVSTNALELGIDVGSLDLAVVAGYPGSSMSFWQQAGRVGRRGERESLVVLVAGDDAPGPVPHPASRGVLWSGDGARRGRPEQRGDPARAPAVRGIRGAARSCRTRRLVPPTPVHWRSDWSRQGN